MITSHKVLIRYLGVFIEKTLLNRHASINIAPLNPGVMKKSIFPILCIFLCSLAVHAQETWGLERCIVEARREFGFSRRGHHVRCIRSANGPVQMAGDSDADVNARGHRDGGGALRRPGHAIGRNRRGECGA